MNGSKKLERYITLDWKGLPVTNTLSFPIGIIPKLRRNWSVVNMVEGPYSQLLIFFITYQWAQ